MSVALCEQFPIWFSGGSMIQPGFYRKTFVGNSGSETYGRWNLDTKSHEVCKDRKNKQKINNSATAAEFFFYLRKTGMVKMAEMVLNDK